MKRVRIVYDCKHTHTHKRNIFFLSLDVLLMPYSIQVLDFVIYIVTILVGFFCMCLRLFPTVFLAVAAFGLGWSVDFFHRCLLYPHAVSILHTQLRLHINTGSCLIIDLEYLTILYDGKHWIIYEYLVCQLILFEWQ